MMKRGESIRSVVDPVSRGCPLCCCPLCVGRERPSRLTTDNGERNTERAYSSHSRDTYISSGGEPVAPEYDDAPDIRQVHDAACGSASNFLQRKAEYIAGACRQRDSLVVAVVEFIVVDAHRARARPVPADAQRDSRVRWRGLHIPASRPMAHGNSGPDRAAAESARAQRTHRAWRRSAGGSGAKSTTTLLRHVKYMSRPREKSAITGNWLRRREYSMTD